MNSVTSTVAAHCKIGQGVSCFCASIIIGGRTTRRFISLVFCWMDFWIGGGSEAVILRLVVLSTSPLSKSKNSWSDLQRGAALTQVTSCRFALCRLVFVHSSVCLKYVL